MSVDPREMRDTVGLFATGVCIMTTMYEGEAIGMTANSFSSLSLDPALALWNIQNDSDCFAAFTDCQYFAINILAADQADLSNSCAKKNQHDLSADQYSVGANGQPVINGALATLECSLWARYPGGDHEIIVGEISQLQRNAGEPLLFFSGGYKHIGA